MAVTGTRDSTIADRRRRLRLADRLLDGGLPGLPPDEITIYGPSDNPVGDLPAVRLQPRADGPALGVRVALPAGRLADVRAARRLVAPQPRAAGALGQAQVQPGRPGHPRRGRRRRARAWAGTSSRVPTRVGWLQREESRRRRTSSSTTRRPTTSAARKHVMLALGHGPLAFPPVLAQGASRTRRSTTASSRPTSPRPTRPTVATSSSAPASRRSTSGPTRSTPAARCIALRRNPAPDEQDLNVPRCLFEALGHRHLPGPAVRAARAVPRRGAEGHRARSARAGSSASSSGRAEGRFEEMVGEIDQVQPGPAGPARSTSRASHGEDPGWLDVTGVVAGHRLQQVGADAAADAPPDRALRHPGRRGPHPLRTNCGVPGPGPRRVAARA